MNRVMVYVDGFNLYFGLRSKGWKKHYWLDLRALALALLKPDQTLVGVHYFTSRIRANGCNVTDMQRQTTYLEALGTLSDLRTHFGHYLEKPRQCRQCGAQWMDYEEKMTDVNIAVQLLADAFEERFDTALLVSGDSDLTTPVSQVCARFPRKRIVIALPPKRRSHQLIQAASGHFIINETAFRHSQLPVQVRRADGFILHRPATWRQEQMEVALLGRQGLDNKDPEQRQPQGYSKKKRTFGQVEFMFGDQVEGRFGGLLGAGDGGSTLH